MLTNLPTVLRQADHLSLTQEQILVEHLQASGGSTPEALIVHGLFSADNLAEHTAHIFGLPLISLADYDYEPFVRTAWAARNSSLNTKSYRSPNQHLR